MLSGPEALLVLGAVAIAAAGAYGWFSDKSKAIKEDTFNRDLRAKLEADRSDFEARAAERQAEFLRREKYIEARAAERQAELLRREKYIQYLRDSFTSGMLDGRRWLSAFVAEADRALDESLAARLRSKARPAMKAADEVAAARAERRLYKERVKFLEYQLLSLKEYFPFLDEYEDIILDESVPLIAGSTNFDALETADPVLLYVPKGEYEKLTTSARNQLALNRYLSGGLSPAAIGRLYERYIGYLFERDGWAVEYHGIVKGLEDLGRDLICSRGNELMVVQAKCWSREKQIHEKHIFQLFGTTQLCAMAIERTDLFAPNITARFVTTTNLSDVARKAAEWLKIEVEESKPLDKTFPMIKCNVNQTTGERIYHLPFDQQYDRVKIVANLGETIVATVAQAEKLGFRRAFKFAGRTQ